MTLSTGKVTRSPWVTGGTATTSGDPRTGEGYDAAVGFALADHLGYDAKHVTWVGSAFADTLKAGAKPFDVNVNQVTITDARRRQVDLSTPYYSMHQAVVSLEGRTLARARSLKALDGQVLGYVQSSPSEQVAKALTLTPPPRPYTELDGLRGAVSDGTVQGLVTDYVTALRLDAVETDLVGGKLVGVLRDVPTGSEEFGLVLAKDSPLTPCVDQSLATMAKDGTLERLQSRWLVDQPGFRDLG